MGEFVRYVGFRDTDEDFASKTYPIHANYALDRLGPLGLTHITLYQYQGENSPPSNLDHITKVTWENRRVFVNALRNSQNVLDEVHQHALTLHAQIVTEGVNPPDSSYQVVFSLSSPRNIFS